MALTINLLHEQQKLERQKQLDPLKLGIYLIGGIVAFFVVYYAWEWFSAQSTFSRRDDLKAQWSKKEKELTGVNQVEAEMKATNSVSTLLSYRIDNRFYWAPFLETLYRSVPPEVQIVSLLGTNTRKETTVSVNIDGMAAGAEPRAAAEKFRTVLLAGIGEKYKGAKVTFRTLEEAGSTVKLDEKDLPTARFSLKLEFAKPYDPVPPQPTPTPTKKPGR